MIGGAGIATRHPTCSRTNADVFRLIGLAPGVGKRYPHASEHVRRVMMRKTRHHVYYIEKEQYVLVVAVWGAAKGSGPDLAGR
jgi:plasmid stabilization system protein ParE